MKQLILILVLTGGVRLTGVAQDSKTKAEGADYKKKVEHKGTEHTAMYSPGARRHHMAHRYRTHNTVHRHVASRRHVYHRHIAHNRRHVYSKPVVHYRKIKRDNKKGEYKAKT